MIFGNRNGKNFPVFPHGTAMGNAQLGAIMVTSPQPGVPTSPTDVTQEQGQFVAPPPGGYVPGVPQPPPIPTYGQNAAPALSCVIGSAKVATCTNPDRFTGCDPASMFSLPDAVLAESNRILNNALALYAQTYPWLPPEQLQPRRYNVYVSGNLVSDPMLPGHDWRPVLTDFVAVPPSGADLPQADIYRYLTFSNDPVPPDFFNPAHAAFDQFDQVTPYPQTNSANQGGLAKAFESAMYLFFPTGKFQVGGSSPGRMIPGRTRGSWIQQATGNFFPYPYWLRTVSEQMVNFATKFIQSGGFGPEAHSTFSAAGAVVSTAAAGAKGFAACAAATPAAGALCGGVAAGLTLLSNLFSFGDPDPPAWFKQLMQIESLYPQKSAWWISGQQVNADTCMPQGTTPADCTRLWTCDQNQTNYTILEAYAEVLRRVAGGAVSTFPWGWAALIGGAAFIGGVALKGKGAAAAAAV